MRGIAAASALLIAILVSGCEDEHLAEIKTDTEAQIAALTAKGQLTAGAVTVEPEGEGYRVEVADVTLLPSPDTRLVLGTVSYLHEPIDEGQVRYADIAVASPVQVQSDTGEPQGTIAFELGKAEGIWSEQLASFVSLDIALPSMRVESLEEPTVADLTGISLTSHTTDPSAERTDTGGKLAIESIAIAADDGSTVVLEGVIGESKLSNVDLAAMAAASTSFETANATGENLAPSIVAMLKSFTTSDMQLTVDRVAHRNLAGEEDFSLTNMRIVGTLSDADKEMGSLNLALGYDSIALPAEAAADPMAALLAPELLAINIDVGNVPFQYAANQLAAIAPSVKEMGVEQPQIAGLVLLSALRAAFAESGTTIRFDGTRIQMKDALVTIVGGVDVQPDAPLGATGAMDVSIFGLDALMQAAESLPSNPENDEFRSGLQYLAAVAERGEEGGETVDRYRIEATEDGSLLVNGQLMF